MILILIYNLLAFASDKEITIEVKGMVCSFCAQGITKKFSTQPSIDTVKVSLERKQVKLTLKEGKEMSDEQIKAILTSAGYNVEKVTRNE